MAAVRLEKLLQENNEGPETHYLLYQCYQRLKKPDSAENIAAKLRRKWPTSKQTKQLPGGIDER
jgi:Tfp pilus assembly protein PilF